VGICERVAAVGLFTLSLPVTLACACTIRILARREPLIAHRRVGRNGATLWMLKLRTMWDRNAPSSPANGWIEYIADDDGPEQKSKNDARVASSFARFLRRHSIDELPQFWHVISGEMSLVGPRPVTEQELTKYYGSQADEVLQLKPGLAGLWQISGRNRLSDTDRSRLDMEYVRNRSVGMYLGILLRTIPEVLSGKNSW
jgi:exopolysaccharide production protein ExoY